MYMRYLTQTAMILLLVCFQACVDKKTTLEEHEFTNDLVHESSPYLLQHAHNPVNWRPWGNSALEEAQKSNKLILVSIGYSACHWCHVMEEETFEDKEVAKMMNDHYVSIKVDREERPDVDHIYMTALQLMKGGGGGWPLNVITLPNGKPIYGGTYHTKEQWIKVLTEIYSLYTEDPKKANDYADMVAKGIQEVNIIEPPTDFVALNQKSVKDAIANWRPQWDTEWGGNTGSQKFMLPSSINFLLDYAQITDDKSVKSFIKTTLDKMALGGVYDHIGGGMYRYSTDRYWKVPHFEKMLYDNAQLLSVYSKAYAVFEEPMYKEIVSGTLAFLEREMKHAEGGYFAALDADSENVEGKFYVWKKEELKSVLGDEFELFASYFNIRDSTQWDDETYVLHKLQGDEIFIKDHNLTFEALQKHKNQWRQALLTVRDKRVRPGVDDKIITSWNALLINGLVDTYKIFGNEEDLKKAEDLLSFLKYKSFQNNRLLHTYKKDGKIIEGFIDDYAFLENAALNLYSVTSKTSYLEFAQVLNKIALKNFTDPKSELFTYSQNSKLISIIIKTNDGEIPSANSIMAHNQFLLGHILYDKELLSKSKRMLTTMVPQIKENANFYGSWNTLLLNTTYPFFEIAIVGKNSHSLLGDLHQMALPNVLLVGSGVKSELPLFENRFVEGETFIYVCKDNACKLPVISVEKALSQLRNF